MDKKILTHRFAKGLSLLFIAALAVGLALGLTMPFAVATPVGADPGIIQVDINDGSCVTGTGQPDPYACVYCNIQDAIDDATSGDIINVAAGTYVENIILKDEVQLFGAGALVTTIDGGGAGSVVKAIDVGPGTVLGGFTITGGSGTVSPPLNRCGGGIYVSPYSSLAILNCVVEGNSVDEEGGGIYVGWGSSVTIANNVIRNNRAYCGGGINLRSGNAITGEEEPVQAIISQNFISENVSDHGSGGGICAAASSIEIVDNTVANNSAYRGGAISVYEGASGTIASNTLSSNYADSLGGAIDVSSTAITITDNTISDNIVNNNGGGIYIGRSSPTVSKNTFQGNSAYWGGGIDIKRSSPTLSNNIFQGNTARDAGGGLHMHSDSFPIVTNNTFQGNSAPSGGGVFCTSDPTPTIFNCILWGNGDDLDGCTATYSDIEDGDPGVGNISEPPMFVDPAGGDYHLQAGSPCIDTGTNEGAPTEDIEGNPRPIDGNGDTTAITDMGAYEYRPLPVGGIVGPVTLSEPGTASDQAPGGATGHTAVALWLGLAFILAIGGGILALRRRRAH